MDNQVQVVDTGRRTLPIHNEETIYFYTRLESVQKRGDLVVVTDHNICYGLDQRELLTNLQLFRPDGLVTNSHTTVPFSEEASRSLVHQVFKKLGMESIHIDTTRGNHQTNTCRKTFEHCTVKSWHLSTLQLLMVSQA
jgi:hypothetical protein